MAFCPNCGSQLNGATPFCPNCGASLTASDPRQAQQPQYQQPQYGQQPQYQQQPIYQQPQYVQTVYAVKPTIPGRGFGIASMILGIIGIVFAFTGLVFVNVAPALSSWHYENEYNDFYGYYSINDAISKEFVPAAETEVFTSLMICAGVLALLALIFGFVSAGKGFQKGQPISGVILGGISSLLIVISIIIFNS